MTFAKTLIVALTLLLIILPENNVRACSMYKITVDGKTMVGCNEDAWRTTSRIWFKNARDANEYGAVFTGSRQVSASITAPQSGMNEVGLTFSRLVAHHPQQSNPFSNRIQITNEVDYLTDILLKCATIEEVRSYVEQYDHSIFNDDVFIYIDSSGNYLVVEPYNLIEGSDPYYVLSNFCPSITDNERARTLQRYRNGQDFLTSHEPNTSLSFCSALSDTMHVSRSRNRDGTLLTSIWDTQQGIVNLYFYHSFETTVQFNIPEELSKGDRVLNIPELFPANPDFERLKRYKTPFNTPELRVSLVILAGLLNMFSLILGISAMRGQSGGISFKNAILIAATNVLLTAYLFILATNISVYYFDAPYKHYNSSLISAASYTPFLLLLIIIPFTSTTIRRLKSIETRSWIKGILVLNNLVYLLLTLSFGYWGLYNLWN